MERDFSAIDHRIGIRQRVSVSGNADDLHRVQPCARQHQAQIGRPGNVICHCANQHCRSPSRVAAPNGEGRQRMR